MARRDERSVRLGRLLGALDSARASLDIARRQRDLLDRDDAVRLTEALDILHGIEQRMAELAVL